MPKKILTEASKDIPELNVIKVWVRAGGRCEFNGCNEYLLKDSLTLKEANFSNIGHIVGRSINGPRGDDPMTIQRRNNVENLMLLCTKHHKLVDDKSLVYEYPITLLLKYKKVHEDRIFRLTGIQPGNKSTVIRMKFNINGEAVDVSLDHIHDAIHPRYMEEHSIDIDLTNLPGLEDKAYWDIGKRKILEKIDGIYDTRLGERQINHLSVFALGPIPLLIHLGSQLSNKIQTDLYQRHRDEETWKWKTKGKIANYRFALLSKGKDSKNVALILSLSGKINPSELPENVKGEYWLYEIVLDNQSPNTGFLGRKESLLTFKQQYRSALGIIRKNHPGISEISLFPAIPAPIAVLCGREILRKVDPSIHVYDFNKNKGGFSQILTIN